VIRFSSNKLVLQSNKGAALLTVLVALLLISLMTLELQYTSLVERKLAYNDLNKIQTHYLAKSGSRLGLLRLTGYGRARKMSIVAPNSKYGQAKSFLDLIWNIPFPAYPPTRAALENLSLQEKAEQLEALKETRITAGQFIYSIRSESSKLNLNLISNNGGAGCRSLPTGTKSVGGFICYTLYQKITELFKESESPTDEFGNVKVDDIIDNLVDWISPQGQSTARDNDGWYERQFPPYKTKRGRFFTIDEVKLVKDISPSLFLKLKPYITVFSEEGKANLTELTRNGSLKLYFSRISQYAIDRINQDFQTKIAAGAPGWASVAEFFNLLKSYDPASATEYNGVENDYFTIDSALFTIQSQGTIQKSGSTIQSTISVAVSITGNADCGSPLDYDQAKCATDPDLFWHPVYQKCFSRPMSDAGCEECFPGKISFTENNTEYVCTPNGNVSPPIKRPKLAAGATAPPRALKIYSWLES
jgi:type II secretory pathway component PulK